MVSREPGDIERLEKGGGKLSTDPFDALDNALDTIAGVSEKIEGDKRVVAATEAIEDCRCRAVGERDPARAFFTSLALSLHPEASRAIDTMATDGKRMLFNPEFTLQELSDEERYGVSIGHEPMHCANQHFARVLGMEDLALLNVAGDLEINPLVQSAGFTLPKSAIFPGVDPYKHCPPGLTMEEYYAILVKNKKDGDAGEGGDDPGGCGGIIAAADKAAAEAASASWQGRVAAAAQEAKRRGTLPGDLEAWIDSILRPKVHWQTVLLDFMLQASRAWGENNWAKPNRRTIGTGLYLPSKRSEELPEMVLSIDVSGSTWGFLDKFAAEMNGILACSPAKLHVVYSDTDVRKVQVWEPGSEPLKLEACGGGGTSHRFLAGWVADMEVEPACVVCLSDGETDAGSDPGVPVLWAITPGGDTDQPYGRVVVIE